MHMLKNDAEKIVERHGERITPRLGKIGFKDGMLLGIFNIREY